MIGLCTTLYGLEKPMVAYLAYLLELGSVSNCDSMRLTTDEMIYVLYFAAFNDQP